MARENRGTMSSDKIESKYEWEGHSVDASTDHVSQMTIVFCQGDVWSTR